MNEDPYYGEEVQFSVMKIADHIYFLVFENNIDQNSTLIRYQEHYEHYTDGFMDGRYFGFEELKAWYIANFPNGKKTGTFTYYTDWMGLNMPSYIMQDFVDGKFDPLSKREQQIADYFRDKSGEKYYVVAGNKSFDKAANILKHEVAHGLYYFDEVYKEKVNEVLSRYDTTEMEKILRRVYDDFTLKDEVHAHAIDAVESQIKQGLPACIPDELTKELDALFYEYAKRHELHLPTREEILAA